MGFDNFFTSFGVNFLFIFLYLIGLGRFGIFWRFGCVR
jgi:hypothetical protein